ncbi:MAG: GxxExxY protein [Crocinitomicaceae bacterium]|jgi:GxxExxY protein
MTENELARIVYHKGMKLHKALGPGLLEKVYEECLFKDLQKAGLSVVRQKSIPIKYNGDIIDAAFRADLIINDKLLLELKSVSQLNDVHMAQTITYLKMTNLKLALLINFNVVLFKDGIRRVINSRTQ